MLPCPHISDRCVTHISKDGKYVQIKRSNFLIRFFSARKGFSIKRECGLGPCEFNDEMANKGLGFDKCDRSKDEYFCVFCCRESGCNKNNSLYTQPSLLLLLLSLIFVVILNVIKNYQPPYIAENE